jgi:histone H3/H4
MTDIIVKAAVRNATGDLNVGTDFYEKLDDEVQNLLDDAERRAQENGRKTVNARDV